MLATEYVGRNNDLYPFWHSSQAKETGFNLSDINGEPLSSYTNPKITEISGFYTSEKRIGTGSDVIAPQKKINFEVNFTINAETNKIIDIFANISNKEPFIISLKATGMTIP